MVIVTVDRVVNQMERNKCAFYEIKDGSRLVDKQDDENVSVEEAINSFRDTFATLQGTFADVKISSKNGKQKAGGGRDYNQFEYKVKIDGAGIGGTKSDSLLPNGMLKTLMDEITSLKIQLVNEKHANQLNELNRRIDEIKNDKSNPILEQGIGLLMNHFGATAAPHAQNLAGPVQTEPAVEDAKTHIKSILKRWAKVDSDFVNVMNQIVTLAEQKPETYSSVKPMLQAQI